MNNVDNQKDEHKVFFCIYSDDITPDDITRRIGIKPYKTHVKGDKPKNKNISFRFKDNLWEIKSNLPYSYSLEEHIKDLLNQLRPHKSQITKNRTDLKKSFVATIFCKDNRPGYIIDEDIIKEISEYNASIDLDIYCPEN